MPYHLTKKGHDPYRLPRQDGARPPQIAQVEVFKMTSVIRFTPTLGALVLFVFVPGTLRAGDDSVNALDGLSAPAQDTQWPSDNAIATFNICVPKSSAAFETSASLLFLQPGSGNLVYSTVVNPFPFLTPHWSDQAVNPRFSPAFNIGMRYIFDNGCDIQLDWTYLNAFDNASTQVAHPIALGQTSGPPDIQALGPSFLIGPPLPFASANALAHFTYNAVNLDAGLFLCAGRHVALRTFAGIQGARISESMSTNFLSADQIFSFTDVPKSSFMGVGPRLGIDLRYICGNFNLRGALGGATLIGGRQNSIDFLTSSPTGAASGLAPNTQFLTSPASTQVVPSIDAKLAASYAIPLGKFGILKCEAGYQAAVYFNVINQYSLTEVTNTPNSFLLAYQTEGTTSTYLRTDVQTQSNFFVHGPFAKLSFQF
jgi:hypothetical protein